MLFYQKAPHLEKINASWKAEMKISKMLFAHIALSSLPVLFSGVFFVGVSSVVALFSAVPLSAMMWPKSWDLCYRNPAVRGSEARFPTGRLVFCPWPARSPEHCSSRYPKRCCRFKSLGQVLKERAVRRLSHGTGNNGSGGAEAETKGVGWVRRGSPALAQVGQKVYLFSPVEGLPVGTKRCG